MLSFSSAGSTFESACIRLIYFVPDSKIEKTILNDLRIGKRKHLINQYIRVAGACGIESLNKHFWNIYNKYKTDENKVLMNYNLITSLGIIGSPENIVNFSAMIGDLKNSKTTVSDYEIARSLYILTSKKKLVSPVERFTVTDELAEISNVVTGSFGRKRSFSEKIIVDSIFRPPKGWKKEAT